MTLHFVAQGVLFALHVVDIKLHTDSGSGCIPWPVGAVIKQHYEVGGWLEHIEKSKEVKEQEYHSSK